MKIQNVDSGGWIYTKCKNAKYALSVQKKRFSPRQKNQAHFYNGAP